MYKCPAVFKGYSWSFMIYASQKCVKLVSHSLFLHFYSNNTLTLIRRNRYSCALGKASIQYYSNKDFKAVTLGWKSESEWHGHTLVELLSAVGK